MAAGQSLRRWLPFLVAAVVIVGIPAGIVVGMRAYQPSGVTETSIQPQAVRLGTDSRTISVGVTWLENGWCLGEFEASATETSSEIGVAVIHKRFPHGGNCAGVGTVYNTAWADVALNARVGTRSIVRSSDGVPLPVLGPNDRYIPTHPMSADIEQYGSLNDSPPLGLKRQAHVTDQKWLENLAMHLDSLPPIPPGGLACPNDDGYYTVRLVYDVGGDESLKISANGCQEVYVNGMSSATAATAWALPNHGAIYSVLNSLLGSNGAS
jgi:hypothetical protein